MFRGLILVTIGLVLTLGSSTLNAQAATPVNRNSTDEVRGVLNYIESISGTHIIAGQHDKPGYPTATYNRAQEITGQYPGIWGGDFGFSGSGNDTIYNRTELVNQAKLKWSQGVIPSLTWHMTRPDKSEPGNWSGGLIDCGLSSDDWQAITTPGTSYYNSFISRIDSIVWALQELQNAGVPVFWRPLHEMNGNWFWWGGNSYYSKELYKIMYDRYTNHWGLNNLIWVWNVDRPAGADLSQYYPGHEYVDILSMDIYNNDFNYNYYQTMQNLANGKPIALGEVGEIPTEDVLIQQPDWTWFMCWTEHLQENNSNAHIQSIYRLDRTLTRDELGNFSDYINIGGNGSNQAYGKNVEVSSVESNAYKGEYTVDGDESTRWSSAYEDNQYIIVDLGEQMDISMVKLKWEDAYAKKYQIQISGNYNDWATVYENYNFTGGIEEVTLPVTSARYVKVYCIERATEYGFSLYELEVY